jgi:putative oxidoreductase
MKAFSRSALDASYVQALLRIVVGIIFLEHGLAKLIDFPHVETLKQTFSIFGPFSEAVRLGAGIIETTGGMLLIIGFFTRPTAFVLSGLAAVAYFAVHAPKNLFPILNGGDAAVLICYTSLFLAVGGAGAWAADNSLSVKRSSGSATKKCGQDI